MRALVLLALSAVPGCSLARADQPPTTAFDTVYQVLLHPRCANCHPAGDAPLQFDDGRPHGQNITRRSEANGLPCATCHRDKNGKKPNTPPGAPHWKMPPAATPMIFVGHTPAQLCAQLKDPEQTGGRDLAALIHHVEHDALVGWGWDPGPGRTPVPIARAAFVAAMKTWADAGAPCPE